MINEKNEIRVINDLELKVVSGGGANFAATPKMSGEQVKAAILYAIKNNGCK